MVNIPEILKNTSDRHYFGNSVLSYIIAVILFVAVFIGLYITKFIILHKLSNLSKIRKGSYFKVVVNTLSKYFSMTFVTVLSIYVSTRHLTTPKVITRATDFLVLAIVGILLIKLVNNLLEAITEDQHEKNPDNLHIVEFFSLVSRSFVTIIITIWVLSNVGVDVTSFLCGLGILSLAIAFALKEIIADIFASIVLMIDKPFEIGDNVKIGDDSGVVEAIGIRSSKIRAAEGYLIIASNRELTSKKINNMKRMERRRVIITFQISQETPRSKLHLVSDIIKDLIMADPNLEFNKVNLVNIGDYAYDYETTYFVNTREFTTHLQSKQALFYGLLERLGNEHISLPYPTQTIIVDH